jgi:hypothetical protein
MAFSYTLQAQSARPAPQRSAPITARFTLPSLCLWAPWDSESDESARLKETNAQIILGKPITFTCGRGTNW